MPSICPQTDTREFERMAGFLFHENRITMNIRKLSVGLALLLAVCVSAQAQFMQDVNGRVVNEMSYTDVEGSPYFIEEWHKGLIRMADGIKVHDGVKLRYDAYKDELEYEKDGKLYRLGPEISAFSIPTGDALYEFQRGFPAVDKQTENSFYQVLHDGNTKLLKHFTKDMREVKAYNSATTTKRFDDGEKLYVLKNGEMHLLKKANKKEILSLLDDERNLMNYIIKEEQLNFRTEDDIVKILEEYDAYKAGRKEGK